MKVFSEFHDGSLDGVLLEGTSALLFLSSLPKGQFVMRLDDLLSLKMDDFRQGNILSDVILREGEEIIQGDIEQLFSFNDDSKAAKKLVEAPEDALVVVEVNSSYGATLFAIAKNVRMMHRQAWFNEFVTTKELGSELKTI